MMVSSSPLRAAITQAEKLGAAGRRERLWIAHVGPVDPWAIDGWRFLQNMSGKVREPGERDRAVVPGDR